MHGLVLPSATVWGSVCLSGKQLSLSLLGAAPVLVQQVQSLGPRGKPNTGKSIEESLTGTWRRMEKYLRFHNLWRPTLIF